MRFILPPLLNPTTHPEPLGYRSFRTRRKERRGHKQIMMNALDSPVTLNYLSYGFFTAVNKMVAAWVAAFTAAFGFWRIGPSSPPRPEHRGWSKDAATYSCAPPVLERCLEELADEPAKVSTRSGTNSGSALATESGTKGKFVLYYRSNDFREGGVEALDAGDDDGVAGSYKFRRWSDMGWEREMEIRMGDLGWYRCQDLAAFNGSVVQLWDGCSRVCTTA